MYVLRSLLFTAVRTGRHHTQMIASNQSSPDARCLTHLSNRPCLLALSFQTEQTEQTHLESSIAALLLPKGPRCNPTLFNPNKEKQNQVKHCNSNGIVNQRVRPTQKICACMYLLYVLNSKRLPPRLRYAMLRVTAFFLMSD